MFAIKNLAFADSGVVEHKYTVPDGTIELILRAVTHDVDVRLTTGTGGDNYTIGSSDTMPFRIQSRDLAGKVLYFTAADGTTLQIMRLTGLMS